MDVTTAVRSDVLPAVGSFLIPGAVAAAPWVALAWGPPHYLKAWVDFNQGIAAASGAVLVVGTGLLVESVGTFVEYHVVDRCHVDRAALYTRWTEFLKIAWVREPIGMRYLRRVLTTFKFELNMLVALFSSMFGLATLWYYRVLSEHSATWFLLLSGLGVAYLAYAAVEDSKLLHRLRGELIEVAREQHELARQSLATREGHRANTIVASAASHKTQP